jgi:hypothetical protein
MAMEGGVGVGAADVQGMGMMQGMLGQPQLPPMHPPPPQPAALPLMGAYAGMPHMPMAPPPPPPPGQLPMPAGVVMQQLPASGMLELALDVAPAPPLPTVSAAPGHGGQVAQWTALTRDMGPWMP